MSEVWHIKLFPLWRSTIFCIIYETCLCFDEISVFILRLCRTFDFWKLRKTLFHYEKEICQFIEIIGITSGLYTYIIVHFFSNLYPCVYSARFLYSSSLDYKGTPCFSVIFSMKATINEKPTREHQKPTIYIISFQSITFHCICHYATNNLVP